MELTGESRETLLTWIQEGSFPKPDTKTSLEADPAGDDLLWRASDVEAWMRARQR
jgi:predicted DNA-binding transcriptional regulator AlpA